MGKRLVVEVLGTQSGSGLLLAHGIVLTAAHLLFPAGCAVSDERAAGNVTVRLADGEVRYAARCVWLRYDGPDRGLDAALLEISGPDWLRDAVAPVRWGRLEGSAEVRVHAFGFPDALVRVGMAELSPVTGVVHTDSGTRSGRPEIVVGGEPEREPDGTSLWAGISGGPVFAAPGGMTSDVLVGVVVGDPAEFASRRLRMIPAPDVAADSAAATVLGRHCGDLVTISVPAAQLPVQPPATQQVRHSLPRDTAAFTGRSDELIQITDASAAGAGGVVAVTAIDGMPGVGKTALAIHAAHMLADRFPDQQMFINLHAHTPGCDPVRPEDALAALLTDAGVDPAFLPNDMDGRARKWRDQMAGQRALLVLDNAASSSQVAPLLPGGGDCLVLITSRRHLGDLPGMIVPVRLDALPAEQAAKMFIRLAPRADADPAKVAEVADLVGNLPLAISLLARVFARHPSWALADLLDEIRADLLAMSAENDSIAVAFEVSYRYLAPAQQELFRLLSLHPGTTTDGCATAALVGASPRQAASLLDALHGEGLLTEPAPRRYGMHDLLRRYARDHALFADPAAVREQALDRLLDYYQHTAALAEARLARHSRRDADAAATLPIAAPDLSDYSQALAWVRAERANLLGCLDHATRGGQNSRIVGLTTGLAAVLRQDGPWVDAVARHAIAVRAAQHVSDHIGQADALTNLATARRLAGDLPGAAEGLKQGLVIYREHEDRLGEANALTELGVVQRLAEDNPKAIATLQQALAIYGDIGDRLGQANALCHLGYLRLLTGEYPAAVATDEQALAIYSNLGDRLGQATALSYLGRAQAMIGDYGDAASALEQALVIYRSVNDRRGLAIALSYLANVQMVRGDFRSAVPALQEALEICLDLGDRLGQATALTYLGNTRRLTGDVLGAAADLEEAADISRDLGDRLGEATALNYLGRVRQMTGDLPGAASVIEETLAIHRDRGDRAGQVGPIATLGAVRQQEGDYPAAAAALEEALAISREFRDQGAEVEVLNSIGNLHRVRGDVDLAGRCHEQALQLARELGSAWDEAHALAGLGRCARAAGHILDARERLQEARVIFQEMGAAEASDLIQELASITSDTSPTAPD